jgi:hypothetical protein
MVDAGEEQLDRRDQGPVDQLAGCSTLNVRERQKEFFMNRNIPIVFFILSLLVIAGCNPSANQPGKPSPLAPIAAGELISVITYPKPIQQMNESDGFKEYLTGRVEVYEHFILITGSGGQVAGEKTIIPHGWYKNLRFK